MHIGGHWALRMDEGCFVCLQTCVVGRGRCQPRPGQLKAACMLSSCKRRLMTASLVFDGQLVRVKLTLRPTCEMWHSMCVMRGAPVEGAERVSNVVM